jgi:hypothetical protein
MYKCPKRSVKRAIVYLENCLEILCYLTEICSNERGGLVAYNLQLTPYVLLLTTHALFK